MFQTGPCWVGYAPLSRAVQALLPPGLLKADLAPLCNLIEMPIALVKQAEEAKLALLWSPKVGSAWPPSSWLQRKRIWSDWFIAVSEK